MRLIVAILFSTGCAWAQIETPAIGAIADSSGALRQVRGVAGSFLLGPATASGVLSAACSERLCLAKTDSKILSATGETDAPAGPAIFGLTGNDAIVYFPESRVFAHWHDDALDPLDWIVDGEVLSIRLRGEKTEIAVLREGRAWIVYPDGSVVDSIAEATGPVLLLPDGVLFANKDEIVLRQDHREVRFELTGAESINAIGPHYAAIHVGNDAGREVYALRTEPGRESLFLLPGMTP